MAKIRLMNQVRIKMKRKKFSTRFAQIVVVTVVLTLFLYFIFQAGLDKSPNYMPDFSWLSTRNVSVFVRPEERTALVEPEPNPCRVEEDRDVLDIRILIAVYSAPRNTLARTTIRSDLDSVQSTRGKLILLCRKTWAKKFREYPGVKLVFLLGRDLDSAIHVMST